MKTPERIRRSLFLLCTSIFLVAATDSFAQLKKMSIEEMTTTSTSILHGKCTKVKSAWNESRDIILTQVTVTADVYLKGNLGNEVTITIPGGQVDDIIYEVSEMPVFTEGTEVFAFLWKHPSGMHLVTGGVQGKMDIIKDKHNGKKTVKGRQLGTSTPIRANDQSTTPEKPKPKRIPLDEFSMKVRGYLK